MIHLITLDKRKLVVGYMKHNHGNLTVLDYDTNTGKFANNRTMVLETWHSKNDIDRLIRLHPKAQIIRIAAHSPIHTNSWIVKLRQNKISTEQMAAAQRIMEGNEPYIDEFGLYVYVANMLDMTGHMRDVDMRYEGEDILPELISQTKTF